VLLASFSGTASAQAAFTVAARGGESWTLVARDLAEAEAWVADLRLVVAAANLFERAAAATAPAPDGGPAEPVELSVRVQHGASTVAPHAQVSVARDAAKVAKPRRAPPAEPDNDGEQADVDAAVAALTLTTTATSLMEATTSSTTSPQLRAAAPTGQRVPDRAVMLTQARPGDADDEHLERLARAAGRLRQLVQEGGLESPSRPAATRPAVPPPAGDRAGGLAESSESDEQSMDDCIAPTDTPNGVYS
jgi:hypothetical protein